MSFYKGYKNTAVGDAEVYMPVAACVDTMPICPSTDLLPVLQTKVNTLLHIVEMS